MFQQLPMYQRLGTVAFKKNLDNIKKLCSLAGNPQEKFRSIHVAGTNGKGSVSHALASILQTAGYKTGLYTSPHLKDFRERIKINGTMISETEVVRYVSSYLSDFEEIKPSFFEMSVAMAFDHFARQKVDVAVVEVGLGGRLDSTNILTPLLSIITNISKDHTQFLGETLPEIAREKAGIIKPRVPVVVGESNPLTDSVFEEFSERNSAPVFFADKNFSLKENCQKEAGNLILSPEQSNGTQYNGLKTDLRGSYQQKNILTVLQAVEILRDTFAIEKSHIYEGLAAVTRNTGLQGRWQQLASQPDVIADTAHNAAGVSEVMAQIKTLHYEKLHIIWGMVNDKDVGKILALLPSEAVYYFTKAKVPRAMQEVDLQRYAKVFDLLGEVYSDTSGAMKAALKSAGSEDLIFIGGSTFVVAELI